MVKVSVIVAIYNMEKYLSHCLDSLLNQTLSEIEIIAIDDGSTDSTPEILKQYATHSDKIKVFTKTNGGAAEARNFGLEQAVGEYIGYVDSDDYVDNDMYKTMYDKAKEKNSEIVECNLRHTYENYEDIEVMPRYYSPKELLCFGRYVVWNKIYKREWLLNAKAHFPVGLIYEDVAFVANITPHITSYDYVEIAPVHYVQRRNSINNSTSKKTMHIFDILRIILLYYKENNFFEEYKSELEYLYVRILLCSSLSRISCMGDAEIRKTALALNWRELVDTFPNWRKNPILKTEKTHQAIFMKTVNGFTYRIYGTMLPLMHKIKNQLGPKWK